MFTKILVAAAALTAAVVATAPAQADTNLSFGLGLGFGGGGVYVFGEQGYSAVKNIFDQFHQTDTHTITLKQKGS